MVTAEGKIMLRLPSQHHLCILQGLMVEQPVKFCPLCRSVAVLVLNGNARELLRTRHFQQLARKNNENFGKKERGLDGVSPLDKEKHKALYYNKAIRT